MGGIPFPQQTAIESTMSLIPFMIDAIPDTESSRGQIIPLLLAGAGPPEECNELDQIFFLLCDYM
jgi:hypothetical protein